MLAFWDPPEPKMHMNILAPTSEASMPMVSLSRDVNFGSGGSQKARRKWRMSMTYSIWRLSRLR